MAVAMEATEAAMEADSVDAKPTRTASRAVEQDISASVFSVFSPQLALLYYPFLGTLPQFPFGVGFRY